MTDSSSGIGIIEIESGLWIWRARHPFWSEEDDFQQVVTSTFVESNGERIVIDPLAPSLDCIGLWERLDKQRPTVGMVTMPDHIRDIDLFVRQYGLKPFGPMFYFPDQIPNSELIPLIAEEKSIGDILPLYDARGRCETPIWVPKHQVIIFGDALTERGGELRVWDSPWHKKREIPALEAMLDLPFEKLIISHCDKDPVHSRKDFERALELPPWR